jgi:hypothetical protein
MRQRDFDLLTDLIQDDILTMWANGSKDELNKLVDFSVRLHL